MAGLTAEQAYGLSQSEIKKVASGFDHAERTGDNTFSIFFVDGSKIDLTIPLPKDGEPGAKGDDGFSPIITENADNTDKIYRLDITTADSTFTTPNLKGADGQGGTGGSGEENTIESISVNGVNVAVDENKNVDITVPEAYDDTDIKAEIAKKADTTSIPSKVSDLENDSKYQTESDVTTTLTDYATKTYVGEQIANAEHLKREIVTVIPSDTEASDNIIYMLKVESATGNDKYQEYMKIDGTVQMVGDTSVDLTDYAKTDEIPTTVAELTDSSSYAKKTDIPTSLPANGGNSDTVNNHTVKSDVPENAVFTDTIYDDTEAKESIAELNSNLVEQKMLGWNVPSECPIQNYTDSDGVFHQKVGRVDLGSLAWGTSSTNTSGKPRMGSVGLVKLIKKPINDNTVINGYCKNYNIITNNGTYVNIKGIGVGASTGSIFVYDENYTDATAFKKAMQGVYLYYELATPITMTIDGNEAISKVNDSLSVIGKCKNLLKPTLQTTTINGVTCTANGDGTYTLNGTATQNTDFTFFDNLEKYQHLKNRTVKLVGCPKGGSNTTYQLMLQLQKVPWPSAIDIGKGSSVTVDNNDNWACWIRIYKDATVSNLTFKPMLVFDDKTPDATYDDFVPYTGDGDTLTHDVAELKNDLAPKKIELQNVDERVTIKDNGSFIINGFAFVNLLVTFKETLPQWSNFVRLPRPKGGNVSVHCENSVILAIYSQDNLPGDCGTTENVASGTEIRLLVNYEVA